MPQAGSAGVLLKVCLGRRKCSTAEEGGSFSDSIRSSRGSAALFQKTCPEGRAFFFLLRKEMKEIFLYKNFIRPAGTD